MKVKCPTDITYRNQLKNKRDMIENQSNSVIEDIVVNRGLDKKFYTLLSSHNTTLPTIYTLIKTHKVPSGVGISTKELEELKVRPIVSCSGSPTEKLASLATVVYNSTPETFIPCHLQKIYTSTWKRLRALTPGDLQGLKFYTADVCALFTNSTWREALSMY